MIKLQKRSVLFAVFGIVFLLMGLLIYLAVSPNVNLSKMMSKIVAFPNVKITSEFDKFVSFYIPDACWSAALTFVLAMVCPALVSAIIAVSFGALWELAQLFDIVSGTCDFFDVIAYFISSLMAYAIINIIIRRLK